MHSVDFQSWSKSKCMRNVSIPRAPHTHLNASLRFAVAVVEIHRIRPQNISGISSTDHNSNNPNNHHNYTFKITVVIYVNSFQNRKNIKCSNLGVNVNVMDITRFWNVLRLTTHNTAVIWSCVRRTMPVNWVRRSLRRSCEVSAEDRLRRAGIFAPALIEELDVIYTHDNERAWHFIWQTISRRVENRSQLRCGISPSSPGTPGVEEMSLRRTGGDNRLDGSPRSFSFRTDRWDLRQHHLCCCSLKVLISMRAWNILAASRSWWNIMLINSKNHRALHTFTSLFEQGYLHMGLHSAHSCNTAWRIKAICI